MSEKKFGKLDDGTAPFNMALDTLRRLGEILEEIRQVDSHPEFSQQKKQEISLSLLKSFFMNASPLLKDTKEKFMYVIDLQPVRKIEVNTKKVNTFFDEKLEKVINVSLINIQDELQKEGYFMPPKNDPRFSWKQD